MHASQSCTSVYRFNWFSVFAGQHKRVVVGLCGHCLAHFADCYRRNQDGKVQMLLTLDKRVCFGIVKMSQQDE